MVDGDSDSDFEMVGFKNSKKREREIQEQVEKMSKMKIDIPSNTLDLSAPKIKALSSARTKTMRLPDIIQAEQRNGINNRQHRLLFEAHLEFHSDGPSIKIENEVDDSFAPQADFVCVDNEYELTGDIGPANNDQSGCDCEFECKPETCSCRKLHTDLASEYYVDFPPDSFAYEEDGRLKENVLDSIDMPIWECNDRCGCTKDCQNKVVGKGRKVAVTIFKHKKKGWCIKLAQNVKKGQFIGIYSGELITSAEAESRNEIYSKTINTYVMDLTFFTIKWNVFVKPYLLHKRMSKEEYLNEAKAEVLKNPTDSDDAWNAQILDDLVDEAQEWYDAKFKKDPLLAIDGSLYGNFVRYIAHSCVPNLTRHMVYTYDRDIRRPFVAYFAKDDLKAGEELTIDYGGEGGQPESTDNDFLGKIRCYCGMGGHCRGFVFTRFGK